MSKEEKKSQSATIPIQSFDPTAKKKKTKKSGKDTKEDPKGEAVKPNQPIKEGGEKEYEYKYLLERISNLLANKSKDPDVRRKVLIKPPDVQKLTGKRSAWINFGETCVTLDRKVEHLLQYVSTELNTDSSLNHEHQLIMKGKVTNKQIESVLKKYISTICGWKLLIDDYVTCANCKHVNTTLYKNPRTRAYEMRCAVCHSVRSVAGIKTGFHAYAKGERKKERAVNQ